MSLSGARQRAMELASLHKAGIKNIREHLEAEEASRIAARDAETTRLAAEKAVAEADQVQQANRKTVSELFEHWAKIDLINRKDGGAEVRRMFEKDVLPFLGTLAVVDVKKGHITEVTDAMLARGVNRAAKIAFSLMRQMFRFAVDRDLIEHDPSASRRTA
ncbi:MAG: phage integrase central domain-containing protein [Pseudomonas sp.]